MITGMLILFGIIIYLIIGRVIVNVLEDYELLEFDWSEETYKNVAMIFFPISVIWVIIRESSEYLSDKLIDFMRNR